MKMNAKNLLVVGIAVVAACSTDKSNATKSKADTGKSGNATPAAATPASYVGSHYDPMPDGVNYESGTVILGKDGKPSSFVLSHVRTPKGLMVWLDEILPDDGVIRRRVVRAAVNDPAISPGERRVIGTCGVDGKFNGDVFAIVQNTAGRRYTNVYRAWRVNLATPGFDSISTKGVVCEEPGGAELPARR